jgi:uncharacterized protein
MKCNPDNHDHCRYFFDSGIRFECRHCGTCCTGDPGIIRISLQEIEFLSNFLKLSIPDLTRIYLRPLASGFSIAEESDGRCRFYDQGCRIYPARPLQCRSYPFWFSQMRSMLEWKKTLFQCPGIGNGPLYSRERILYLISRTM